MEVVKQQAYDIVISDYKLPGMDGLEFLRRVKEKQPHVFEIFITAYANGEICREAKMLGDRDLITKPFTSGVVETSLSRTFEKSSEKRLSKTVIMDVSGIWC